MESEHHYQGLRALLESPTSVLDSWIAAFIASPMRMPRAVDVESLRATLEPITDALANVVAPDRSGRRPATLHFVPGGHALRDLEKAVSFASAHLVVDGLSVFDVGALLFGLRDTLCAPLEGSSRDEMQRYMEWLVVLAADALATGREQAAVERWHNQLDEGTPLVMITPELPAALFVCEPNRRVISSVLGRLLLTVVRTGSKAAIIDIRGMSGRPKPSFYESLESFVGHARIANRIKLLACGVHADDMPAWRQIGDRSGTEIHFETHFDSCVAAGIQAGGWRLVSPQ